MKAMLMIGIVIILAAAGAFVWRVSTPQIIAPEDITTNASSSLVAPSTVSSTIELAKPIPVPTTAQGIYGITYWVSGMERSDDGPNKGGYFAEIPVFKLSRRPAPGTQNVTSASADAVIKSDMKGEYRLALAPGEYCAWDDTIRNCFTADLVIKTGEWKRADFTLFGQ